MSLLWSHRADSGSATVTAHDGSRDERTARATDGDGTAAGVQLGSSLGIRKRQPWMMHGSIVWLAPCLRPRRAVESSPRWSGARWEPHSPPSLRCRGARRPRPTAGESATHVRAAVSAVATRASGRSARSTSMRAHPVSQRAASRKGSAATSASSAAVRTPQSRASVPRARGAAGPSSAPPLWRELSQMKWRLASTADFDQKGRLRWMRIDSMH